MDMVVNTPERSVRPVRTALRVTAVLNALSKSDGKGVSAISNELGLSKGTVFGLLRTLELMDYVVQDQTDRSYRLGPAILRIAIRHFQDNNVVSVAHRYLQDLADEVGEVVHLGRLEHMSAFFLDRAVGSHVSRILVLDSQVGAVSPLHCTSMGKIFLAHMGADGLAEYLGKGPLRRYSHNTIVEEEPLRTELARIRAQGYALNVEEFEEGVSSIAVPVFGAGEKVIAGLNAVMPSFRMPPDRVPTLVSKLAGIARRIESDLAGQEPPG